MKNTLLNTIALAALFLTSCGEATAVEETTDAPETDTTTEVVEEVIEEIVDLQTVTDEQMAHYEEMLDLTSTETTFSDCFIKEGFLYMDQWYITVDFVNYKLDEDSKNTDYEVFDLVNEIKTLRTFVVNEEYLTCGQDKTLTLEELLEKNKNEKNLVFSLQSEDGIVTELYIDTCSG